MKPLSDASAAELRDIRAAASEAIAAMAWFDLQCDALGLRQSGAEWSAAAEALRKIDAELAKRQRAAVS